MGILAGTSRGLYRIDESAATKVLDKPLVRDLTAMGDWLFAGSSEGLFVSTDQGASWSPAGLEGLLRERHPLIAAHQPYRLWGKILGVRKLQNFLPSQPHSDY